MLHRQNTCNCPIHIIRYVLLTSLGPQKEYQLQKRGLLGFIIYSSATLGRFRTRIQMGQTMYCDNNNSTLSHVEYPYLASFTGFVLRY